jgi:hypothetical protein
VGIDPYGSGIDPIRQRRRGRILAQTGAPRPKTTVLLRSYAWNHGRIGRMGPNCSSDNQGIRRDITHDRRRKNILQAFSYWLEGQL